MANYKPGRPEIKPQTDFAMELEKMRIEKD